MKTSPTIALIGAGSMGGALLRGWVGAGAIACEKSCVFDPKPSDDLCRLAKEYGFALNEGVNQKFDVLIVAVKPQIADTVLPEFAAIATKSVVVSVMAGKSVDAISKVFGGGAMKLVRAMPNLPAAIGKGATGLFANDEVSSRERSTVETLMATAGETVWVEKETDIDLVTAISGSGPAYFFLLTEALAEAGEDIGLSAEAAVKLAHATLSGAGALMDTDGRSAGQLRKAVTSPGGTTEAAINVFESDHELRKVVKKAVAAAARRAGELSG